MLVAEEREETPALVRIFPRLRIPTLWIIITIQRDQRESGTRLSDGLYVCVPVPALYMSLKRREYRYDASEVALACRNTASVHPPS
jgi:hypothetical protein